MRPAVHVRPRAVPALVGAAARRPRRPLPSPVAASSTTSIPPPPRRAEMRPETEVPGLTPFLDSLKFGKADGLLVAIVQVRMIWRCMFLDENV